MARISRVVVLGLRRAETIGCSLGAPAWLVTFNRRDSRGSPRASALSYARRLMWSAQRSGAAHEEEQLCAASPAGAPGGGAQARGGGGGRLEPAHQRRRRREAFRAADGRVFPCLR